MVKARQENNLALVVSLCSTLLDRDIPEQKTKEVLWERGQGQRKLGRLEEAQHSAEQLLAKSRLSEEDSLTQGHLLMLQVMMDNQQLADCKCSVHALYLSTRLAQF